MYEIIEIWFWERMDYFMAVAGALKQTIVPGVIKSLKLFRYSYYVIQIHQKY